MKITTKTGDSGKTDIIGERVDKCCDIIEYLGTLDEVCSVINLLRCSVDNEMIKSELLTVVEDVVCISSFVAKKEPLDIKDRLTLLEEKMSKYEEKLCDVKLFTYPENKDAAIADYARCVIRRCERCGAKCKCDITYLNRLSDYMYVLSRYMEIGE